MTTGKAKRAWSFRSPVLLCTCDSVNRIATHLFLEVMLGLKAETVTRLGGPTIVLNLEQVGFLWK